MYHVIMNDPMKTRKVLSCMAITAIIKKKNYLINFRRYKYRFKKTYAFSYSANFNNKFSGSLDREQKM
jgi:hypothetical protein